MNIKKKKKNERENQIIMHLYACIKKDYYERDVYF